MSEVVTYPGRWQPQKLDGDHRHMLLMHCAGFSHREIAEHLGCTPQTVSNIVCSDLGRAWVNDMMQGYEQEFLGLFPRVITTIREALTHEDMAYRLQAADKWLKAHGKYSNRDAGAPPVSAEDIVQRLLARGSMQVNIRDSNVAFAPQVGTQGNLPPDAKVNSSLPSGDKPSFEPPHPFREVDDETQK